jgi:hypothetical protein
MSHLRFNSKIVAKATERRTLSDVETFTTTKSTTPKENLMEKPRQQKGQVAMVLENAKRSRTPSCRPGTEA